MRASSNGLIGTRTATSKSDVPDLPHADSDSARGFIDTDTPVKFQDGVAGRSPVDDYGSKCRLGSIAHID